MNRGFTLIEVVVGTAILSFFAMGSLSLYSWVAKEGERTAYLTRRNVENEQMLKQLKQPVYFGLLAGYEVNKSLKECISADGVLCDVSKDYELTAIDLKTGMPLVHVSENSGEGIKNILSFKVHCPINQSSCDQPEYFVVKVKTEISKAQLSPLMIENTAMVAPLITSTATFTPDAAMSPGRNINVVLFLDNSNSLVYVKEKVKAALAGLIDTLGTLNTRVGIYNLSLARNLMHSSTYYTLSGMERTNLSFDEFMKLPGGTTYYEEKVAKFNYSGAWTPTNPYYAMVDFNVEDDSSTKLLKIEALNNRVEKLFAEGQGTTWDTPFCQMVHLIESENPVIPINSQVPTVFIVLTNEDEGTELIGDITGGTYMQWKISLDCFKALTAEYKTEPSKYAYWGKKIFHAFKVRADFIADGAPATYEMAASVPVDKYDPTIVIGSDCTSKAAESNEAIKRAILSYYPNSDVVFTGNYSVISCTSQLVTQGLKSSTEPDLCITDEVGFITNFPWYQPSSCFQSGGGSSSSFIQWTSVVPMVEWTSSAYLNQDAGRVVYEKLSARNLLNNIFYIPIIHQQSQSGVCPLTEGAAYGNKYDSLSSLLGTQSEVVSICGSDYTAKIKAITEGFISELGLNDIEIPAEVAAALKSVEITRGTTVLYPVKDVDYQLFNTTLIFTSGYLRAGDIIKVYTQ